MTALFPGVYRGTVENEVDPLQRGRVQVSVPSVFGEGKLAWAEACVRYAGDQVGAAFVPARGAQCFVAFEGGNPDYPVLLGVTWGRRQCPAPPIPDTHVFATKCVEVTVSDVAGAGGVKVKVSPPAVTMPVAVTLGAAGIELSVGATTIALDGVRVSINKGALEVI